MDRQRRYLHELLYGSREAKMNILYWLVDELIPLSPPDVHFSGACGDDTSLTPYDKLTPAEHDALGEYGAFIMWNEDEEYRTVGEG